MRVSVLSHNLSSNALGRAHVLAELLERNFDVEVAGPPLYGDIWEPLADEWPYIQLDITEELPSFARNARKASKRLNGDFTVAVKPRATSFGIGLLRRYFDDVPIVLDIDDWETGGAHESPSRLNKHLQAIPHMYKVNSLNPTYVLESVSAIADGRTVSNSFLQNKFGGTLIPHARDTDKFDPRLFKKPAVRSELGLHQDKTIAMFSGTPRPHKGVDDLITAINKIDTSEIIGVIVGAHDSEYVDGLKRQAGGRIELFEQQSFDDLPKWIAASDIFVIPQKQTAPNRGQLPAKVFDAMAMAKPIIATEMSDLPIVLDGCGLIVEPGSPDAIAEKLLFLHNHPKERETLGNRARERCVRRYSYNALAPRLEEVIRQVYLKRC